MTPPPIHTTAHRLLAWLVHLYTALGLVLGACAAVLVVRGGADFLRTAFLLLALATLIDATDGWLARRADVRGVLPWFDGRRLDDIIDFQTYTALPLLVLWRSGVLAPHSAAWLLLPLLASAYGFSQIDAKTADGYFRGFPSYWNVVALYLCFLRLPAGLALALIVVLALLTFVPAKYLYPSQPGRLNRITIVFGAIWAAALLLVLLDVPAQPQVWLLASLAFPIYYLVASWVVTVRDRGAVRP